MKIKPIPSSEITPEKLYLTRRQFIKRAAFVGAGLALAACLPNTTAGSAADPTPADIAAAGQTDELGNELSTYQSITHYNNYYEFTTNKDSVAAEASRLTTSPWQIQVDGLVHNPKTYDLDDLLNRFNQEERIYRLRCVEGWSMVIPWIGFPLARLLKEVEPMTSAKYISFQSLSRPEEMPGQENNLSPWPYLEGLRLDEASNDLALLATGLYGKTMPAQNGAPIRLVVPWKYGFKSAKAIVRIKLVAQQPPTFWNMLAPQEYGFYSNVNPERSHPRWSQATERRIGESDRRETLMFNGYTEQVAGLYSGMDLQVNY
jgi:sulfoxide reductase catalytic subunit YedY